MSVLAALAPIAGAVLVQAIRLWFFVLVSAFRREAENEFLRKQLAMYVERGARPRRARNEDKAVLVLLARLCPWRGALVVVTPRTLIDWQRSIERSFWRWISRPRGGWPKMPVSVRAIIRTVARENPQWSCGAIARVAEAQLGIAVDEKTVRKYLPPSDPRRRRGRRSGDQTWSTFIRNHAGQIAACDFVSTVQLRFTMLYIFVVMEIGSRRILHIGVTEHPTAAWTSQQLREANPASGDIKYLVHDGAGMFNSEFRAAAARLGVKPLRTPPYAPQANAFCERLVGTIRRECLDWILALSQGHLRTVLREWATHYNRARPHMALGNRVPEPNESYPAPALPNRHAVPADARLISRPVLNHLHHQYRFERDAA